MAENEKLFTVPTDPYGAGYRLFSRENVIIEPGLTLLAGCNGAGKTTLLKLLHDQVQKMAENNSDIICMKYDNLVEGGSRGVGRAMWKNNVELAATMFVASEGEQIKMNVAQFTGRIGQRIRSNADAKEMWIFMDAIGSGMSIDAIDELKEFFQFVIKQNEQMQVYIIVATNEFEYVDGERCLDVGKMKYMKFNNYQEYKKFILESRKRRDSQLTEK